MNNFSESDKEFLDMTQGERKNFESKNVSDEPCMSELNGTKINWKDEAEGLSKESFEAAIPKFNESDMESPIVFGTGGEMSDDLEKPDLYELVYESYHMLVELTEKKAESENLEAIESEEKYNIEREKFLSSATTEQLVEMVELQKEEIKKLSLIRPDFPAELISDGYHTFKELYEFRLLYNAALFNEWAKTNNRKHTAYIKIKDEYIKAYISNYAVHKSWNHHDGEPCFGGGWFIVSAMLPTGLISNHYKAEYWEYFKVPEVEKALFEFDGHTSEDVQKRLTGLILSK